MRCIARNILRDMASSARTLADGYKTRSSWRVADISYRVHVRYRPMRSEGALVSR